MLSCGRNSCLHESLMAPTHCHAIEADESVEDHLDPWFELFQVPAASECHTRVSFTECTTRECYRLGKWQQVTSSLYNLWGHKKTSTEADFQDVETQSITESFVYYVNAVEINITIIVPILFQYHHLANRCEINTVICSIQLNKNTSRSFQHLIQTWHFVTETKIILTPGIRAHNQAWLKMSPQYDSIKRRWKITFHHCQKQ